jgi:diaminohydroxyphosphoribosylaminopyrimidine deaminase/5-amino-6-(5-phosphoribosylamino)uracil reductase
VISDEFAALTTVVVTTAAPPKRVEALAQRVNVWIAPTCQGRVDLVWLLKKLGAEDVTSLLVEGGGEVNAAFLTQGLAQRIVFFYAPKILGGSDARSAVAGHGIQRLRDAISLRDLAWRRLGPDLMLTARLGAGLTQD